MNKKLEEYLKKIDSVTNDMDTVAVMNIDPFYPEDYSIDALIAPIIELLNDNDVKTIACCSGHENESKKYGNTNGYLWVDINIMEPPFLYLSNSIKWIFEAEHYLNWLHIDTRTLLKENKIIFRWRGNYNIEDIRSMMKEFCTFLYKKIDIKRKRELSKKK